MNSRGYINPDARRGRSRAGKPEKSDRAPSFFAAAAAAISEHVLNIESARRSSHQRFCLSAARLLIGKSVIVPIRVQAEVPQHLQVLFDGLVQGGQIISNHQRAGARHENHALHIAQIHGATARDHDFLARQNVTETGNRLEDFHWRQRRILSKRCAFDRIENIYWHDIRTNFLQRERQIAAVLARFTHADDSAGTNLDAGLFQIRNRPNPILISVGRTLLRKKSLRCLQVVPVAL